uniref:Cuticular protein 10 n=1 Tax=Microplitis mediator TaxID=375433 RepID=A0A650DLF5_9HYME|nr:cuticular protein 10 [Microplitis mediator]
MNSKIILSICLGLVIGISGQRVETRPSSKSSPAVPPSPQASSGSPPKDQATIVRQSQDINPDGSHSSQWETSDGIVVQETGVVKNAGQENETQSVQGSASWTAPDGQKISISWTADENGAVFAGDHLPTPPPTQPIPEIIQRAIDWAAKNPSPDYKKE